MPRILGTLIAATALSAALVAQSTVTVVVETELGTIEVQLEPARAPITVANFLRYVDGGLYDGGRFHRAVTMENQVRSDVKIEVIQAGRSPDSEKKQKGFGPIALERTSVTGLRHRDGAISMARGNAADSASADFFICIGDQPSLDFGGARNPDGQGFAAFGRVVKGMEVVRQIQMGPAPKERLDPPIRIARIYRKQSL
jgi:peptidyl-prolyl cis-trans isomerase A (cyclophilin A)